MEEKVILTSENMKEYFRQSSEYIFLDHVEIIPGKSASAVKMVSAQDWYFQYHFPGNPVMPGVFQMEAIMQTGGLIINALKGKKNLSLLFRSCKSVRIHKAVRPGDVLKTRVILNSYRRGVAWFQGEALVGDALSCTIEFSLIAPDEIPCVYRERSNPN